MTKEKKKQAPNLWHFQQKLKGGRVYELKTKKKPKYKTNYREDYTNE